MSLAARLLSTGDFRSDGDIDEVRPAVTRGLTNHFSMTDRNGANLVESGGLLDWRKPENWVIPCSWDAAKQAIRVENYNPGYIGAPIIINPAYHYEIQMSVYVESHTPVHGDPHLYLGGAGWDSSGVWVTTNWMYFLACGHDYAPLTGVWTTFRTTLSGKGALPYASRYAFPAYPSMDGGWAENGRITYEYRYGGLFNYGSAGVMYIRDCSVRVVDPEPPNCTKDSRGVTVDEDTVNLMGTVGSTWAWTDGGGTVTRNVTGIVGPVDLKVRGLEVARISATNVGTPVNGGLWTLPVDQNAVTYTYSVWVMLTKGTYVALYQHWNPWTQSPNFTPKPGVWTRISMTITTSLAGYASVALCVVTDGECYATAPQYEQRSFMTSYVPGSRPFGSLSYSDVLSPSKGTVVVDVTFHEDNTVNGYQGSDQYCFTNMGNWNSANTWKFHDTQTFTVYGNDGVAHTAYMVPEMVREERTRLAFVYDDSDGTLDIYKNGVLASDGTKHTDMIGKLGSIGTSWSHSGHVGTGGYIMCQTVHSLSFYREPLTAAEIKALHGGLSVKQDKVLTKVQECVNLLEHPLAGNDYRHTGVVGGSYWGYNQPNCYAIAVKASRGKDRYCFYIYRPASVPEASTWGGLCLNVPEMAKTVGRRYRLSFWYKGQTSCTPHSVYFAVAVGWPDMGQGLGAHYMPGWAWTDFSSGRWVYYESEYTVGSDRWQVGNPNGVTYDTYQQLKFGFTYEATGAMGTRIFIDDVRIEDITGEMPATRISGRVKDGALRVADASEGMTEVYVLGSANAAGDIDITTLPQLAIGGVSVTMTASRGLTLVQWTGAGTVSSNVAYDVYGVDSARTALAYALDAIPAGTYWALLSYDACGSNSTLNGTMQRMGFREYPSYDWGSYVRSAYVAIGKGQRCLKEDLRGYGVDRWYATAQLYY